MQKDLKEDLLDLDEEQKDKFLEKLLESTPEDFQMQLLEALRNNLGGPKRVQEGDRVVEYWGPKEIAQFRKISQELIEAMKVKNKKVRGIRVHKLTDSKKSRFERII